MHPAPSVILFTTLSGLGFGLLFWLGIGQPAPIGQAAFFWFALANLLAVGGLIASTTHLGRPERAFKAFAQWRSSWLSREGICAVTALLVMAIYAAGLVFFDQRWTLLGIFGAGFSLLTIFTTSMIYSQLKTVPRWHHWTTPALFLMLALGGGALLAFQLDAALWLLFLTGLLQTYAWIRGDKALLASGTNMATATGLGQTGNVRAFEPPHTGTNYLLREFVYVLGRKHALKLRLIAIALGFFLPVLILLVSSHVVFIMGAAVSHLAGIAVLRWLFFAQAEHVVGLYYGKRIS